VTSVKVVGTLIQPLGANVTLETTEEILDAQKSELLKSYLIDDAYGAGSSTLILANAAGDIAQSSAISYLESANVKTQNWFGGWG
jgi:hypothetical protein